jgi:hypothetical protein
MDGHKFITTLIKSIEEDKKVVIEIPMPELVKVLFNGKPVKEYDLVSKMISLRKDYGIDYIVALPQGHKPPMVRFWKINKTKEIPENIDEHNENSRTNGT